VFRLIKGKQMTKFMHFEMQTILVHNEIKHTLYTLLLHVDLCYRVNSILILRKQIQMNAFLGKYLELI